MLGKIERKLLSKYKTIAGIDEVGRGAIAGPIVSAIVVIDKSTIFNDAVNDSKKLTKLKRGELNKFIRLNVVEYKVAEISAEKIDEIGIANANKLVWQNAYNKLQIKPDFVITDYFKLDCIDLENQLNLVKGDLQSYAVACASIIAKVYRDNLMKNYSDSVKYGWNTNAGYGTKKHLNAISNLGITSYHRKSFLKKKI